MAELMIQGWCGVHDRAWLLILCCLLPLAALAATIFLNTPVWPTEVVALLTLAPLGYRLLVSAARPD